MSEVTDPSEGQTKAMRALLDKLLDGEDVEFAARAGILSSSKSAWKESDDQYAIHHDIDGTVTRFTKLGIIEVFTGDRSPWDGDLDPDQKP